MGDAGFTCRFSADFVGAVHNLRRCQAIYITAVVARDPYRHPPARAHSLSFRHL